MKTPPLKRISVLLLLLLPALACGPSSDLSLDSRDPLDDSEAERQGLCVRLTSPRVITTSTALCAGVHPVKVAPGQAAITIGAAGVILSCASGATLEGTGGFGTSAQPTIGILVGAHADVTVRGCGARGFRYGLVARESARLTVDQGRFDDNFNDPSQGWVQDNVKGGGIRLDAVSRGTVIGSSFARNWNGIELRRSRWISVKDNKADHCANWGALLDDSDFNELRGNDFSWAIRGGLTYPGNWYKKDTKDSAAVVVDSASSWNRIIDNDARYGGDGIFIRAIIGSCPTNTWVEGNDVSYSPHMGIESWCPRATFVGNLSLESDHGMWLGGSIDTDVRGNRIEGSKVYGIAVMENENVHTVIEGNVLKNNNYGIMISGQMLWPGDDKTIKNDPMANSSHTIVQRNTFEGNGGHDVYVAFGRSVVAASNCGNGGGPAKIGFGIETAATRLTGTCGGAAAAKPPTARLAWVTAPALGQTVTLNASSSSPGTAGAALTYTWLVQSALPRFANNLLPEPVLAKVGGPSEAATFSAPGMYDVDLTVDDGRLAGMTWRRLAVLPVGQRVGQLASEWTYGCSPLPCTATVADQYGGVEATAVKVTSSARSHLAAIVPGAKNLGVPLTSIEKVGFFLKVQDIKPWQKNFPVVSLHGLGGSLRFSAAHNILKFSESDWYYFEVPVQGGGGWNRTSIGTLTRLDWIELHTDTHGLTPASLSVDALTLY
jgi:parallel beta-helix repeat protein